MGCDIHLVVEGRRVANGPWIGIHAFPHPHGSVWLDEPIKLEGEKDPQHILFRSVGDVHPKIRSRNYNLFAALAGVRGSGPKAKGVPKDASPLALLEIEDWGIDGHSHSYCSAREFITKASQHGTIPDLVRRTIELGEDQINDAIEKWLGVRPDRFVELRVIFWFDN